MERGVILLERDIFLTPTDHQKAEDARGVEGRKTVPASDSSDGNVIKCKRTDARCFKIQPKQHFEILTLLSAIFSADYSFKKRSIQFIFKKTKHFPFNTHIFN